MDLELMIDSFPKLLSATFITLKLLSLSLIFGLKILIFSLIIFFDLNFGPIIFPINSPKLDAFLYPMILKIINKNKIIKNSKKYLKFFINIFL